LQSPEDPCGRDGPVTRGAPRGEGGLGWGFSGSGLSFRFWGCFEL